VTLLRIHDDPIQDWFRYELLGRHRHRSATEGGATSAVAAVGWVDADSFSLRNLQELLEARLGQLIDWLVV